MFLEKTLLATSFEMKMINKLLDFLYFSYFLTKTNLSDTVDILS